LALAAAAQTVLVFETPAGALPLEQRISAHIAACGLAGDWKPRHLETIATIEVDIEGIAGVLGGMLAGNSVGRTLVKIGR